MAKIKNTEPVQDGVSTDADNLESSGFLEPVVVRSDAIPDFQANTPEPEPILQPQTTTQTQPVSEPAVVEPEVEQKQNNSFGMFFNNDLIEKQKKIDAEKAARAAQIAAEDTVPQMTFEQAQTNTNQHSATDQLKENAGNTTSDFILHNLENLLPELAYSAVSISKNKVADKKYKKQYENALIESIDSFNKTLKPKLVIPEWHLENIRKPLRAYCIEKNMEQVISPGVQLAVGLLIFVVLYGGMVFGISRENKRMEKAFFDRIDEIQKEEARVLRERLEKEKKDREEAEAKKNND